MNVYDSKKPVIGTIFELAWYYTKPEKCVVGVFDGDPFTDVNCGHPFVKASVNVWCKTHTEAANLLIDFYK